MINNRKPFIITLTVLFIILVFIFTGAKNKKEVVAAKVTKQAPASTTHGVLTTGKRATAQPSGYKVNVKRKKKNALSVTYTPSAPVYRFYSKPESGTIGAFTSNAEDNPADNVFTLNINKEIGKNDRVWLTYVLEGVDDYTNVACSINDRLSMGGYLVKKSEGEKEQRIEISSSWIQKGKNRISFGLAKGAGFAYKVSDLTIEIEPGGSKEVLIVNNGHATYNDQAYVHGFVKENISDIKQITISGKKTELTEDGEFEAIVSIGEKGNDGVEVTLNDGRTIKKRIGFENHEKSDYEFAFNRKKEKEYKTFEKDKPALLATRNASIRVKGDELLSSCRVSLTTLRDMDMPALDMGMTNVTAGNAGFRFLPHGEHFTGDGASISLKYDRTKIPDGFTENDIRTYYFDNNTNHWVALERDSVDKTLCMVVSKTTHFTDMINGVIKTPESPETQGFAPTMMNDIKAADPTSKIGLVAPPAANSNGTANLSYTLEVPPARNGMAPNLTIQYNSDGGSGWLGEGWDLSVPSVTVDTRWGVPRYDAYFETETYCLNGNMLATLVQDVDNNVTDTISASVAHRGKMFNRLPTDKINGQSKQLFYPCAENDFSQIYRYGNSVDSYFWEITDKNGIKYIYGNKGDSKLTGSVSTFQCNNGNCDQKTINNINTIAEWKIKRVQDLYSAFYEYNYKDTTELITEIGGSNKISAASRYLQSIKVGQKYSTGTDEKDSVYYTIEFFNRHTDKLKKTFNGRYGFMTANNRLLEKVVVTHDGKPVRSYRFVYKNGALGTELLDSIVQRDSAGIVVASHKLEYYDNVTKSNGIQLFQPNTETIKQGDGVADNSILRSGKTTTSTYSIGGSVGVSLKLVEASVGYNHGFSSSKSSEKTIMIDINGDALPDKVFIESKSLYFYPNLGNNQFGNKTLVSSFLDQFSYTESKTNSNGWSGDAGVKLDNVGGISIDAGMDWSDIYSSTPVYFADVNNDGLVDLVFYGVVYFNTISDTIDYNGKKVAIPSFTLNSGYTFNPIRYNYKTIYGKAVNVASQNALERAAAIISEEKKKLYDAAPMQDIVRVWEAPYTGNVMVTDNCRLLFWDPSSSSDGVTVSIQKGDFIKGDLKLKEYFLNSSDTQKDSFTVYVRTGERLYFRLQSASNPSDADSIRRYSNGINDIVTWNPVIRYKDIDNTPDENRLNSEIFKASDAYNVVSKIGYNEIDSGVPVNLKGKIKLPAKINSPIELKVYVSNSEYCFRDSIDTRIKRDTLDNGSIDTIKVSTRYKVWYGNPNYIAKQQILTVTIRQYSDGRYYVDYSGLSGPQKIQPNLPTLSTDDGYTSGSSSSEPSYNFIGNPGNITFTNLKWLEGVNRYWFEVNSATNEDWNSIKWLPELHFTNKAGRDSTLYMGVKYNAYSKKLFDGEAFSIDQECRDDKIEITPRVTVNPHNLNITAKLNCSYTLVVYEKKTGVEKGRLTGTIVNNNITANEFKISYGQDPLYSIIYLNDTTDIPVNATINCKRSVDLPCSLNHGGINENHTITVYRKRSDRELNYGPMWRGWGQFMYNASGERWKGLIKESELTTKIDTTKTNTSENKLTQTTVFAMTPDFEKKTFWRGMNDHMYMCSDTLSTGRLNIEAMPELTTNGTTGANKAPAYDTKSSDSYSSFAFDPYFKSNKEEQSGAKFANKQPTNEPNKVSTTNKYDDSYTIKNAPSLSTKFSNQTTWGGATATIGGASIGVSASGSDGTGYTTMAFTDMNGDGYPDRITEDRIEYSNARGGRDNETTSIDREKNKSSSTSWGLNGGSCTMTLPINFTLNGQQATKLAQVTAGMSIGGGEFKNKDAAAITYLDINGDGLPDKIFKNGNSIYVAFNLGYGFTVPLKWGLESIKSSKGSGNESSIGLNNGSQADLTKALKDVATIFNKFKFACDAGIGINSSESRSYTLYTLDDMNGDGLTDKVYIGSDDNIYISLNYGTMFSTPINTGIKSNIQYNYSYANSANMSVNISVQILFIKIGIKGSACFGRSADNTLNNIQDINGDGYPDLVGLDEVTMNNLSVYRSTIGCTNKLKSVSNSLGGSFRMSYKRSESSFEHPGGKWVMDSLTVNDGITADGPNQQMVMAYAGGKYDRHEHEFLGFARVTTGQMAGGAVARQEVQEYDNSNIYTKGNLICSTLYGGTGARKYTRDYRNYYSYNVLMWKKGTSNQGELKFIEKAPTADELKTKQYIMYSPVKYTASRQYGEKGDSLLLNESFSEYYTGSNSGGDTYTFGELRRFKYSDTGNLGPFGYGTYNYMTETEYTRNKAGATAYVCSLPVKHSVKDKNGNLLRQMFATWKVREDGVTLPLMEKVKYPLTAGKTDTAIFDFEYSRYGNMVKKTFPKNEKGERMFYTVVYDNKYNIFPVKVTDAFGYSSTLGDYNYKYGIPCTTTDMNGGVMTTRLDNLGRVVSILGPNEKAAGKTYTLKMEYYPNKVKTDGKGNITAPAYAITKHYDPANSGNDIETSTFTDGFGRALQVKKDAYIGGKEKSVISGRVNYDAFGRTVAAYYPMEEDITSTSKSTYNSSYDTGVSPAVTTYDGMDRPLTLTTPDGKVTRHSYAVDVAGRMLADTVTDAMGGRQATFANGSGLTVKTEQYSGPNGTITTRFAYDAINRVATVTDTKGGVTRSGYDLGGRRTQVIHPASGTTNFEYDPAGNLTGRQTANLIAAGKKIQYYYRFNRMDSIAYPNHPENNVKYYYGAPSETGVANAYRAGRLKRLEDGSGTREYSYGLQGELTRERRTLVIPNQAVATYTTAWTYDTWNRLTTMTYPDGDTLTYAYNPGGQLKSVTGAKNGTKYSYVSDITYDKFEQRTQMTYGNGNVTNYTYDSKSRNLGTLKVTNAAKATLMNNTYTYDDVDNVTSVVNSSAASTDGVKGTMKHEYKYDGLYRLKTAKGAYVGGNNKTASYTLGMEYDNLHNITRKTEDIAQTRVQFEGVLQTGYDLSYYHSYNPQQVSSVADVSYRAATVDGVTTGTVKDAPDKKATLYSYDANGNMMCISSGRFDATGTTLNKTNERRMLWDEENRLLAVSDNGYVSNYWYDAAGERAVKESGETEAVAVNGKTSGARTATTRFTAYISPYTVVSNGGYYTNHVYIGSQRIESKLGSSDIFNTSPVNTTDLKGKFATLSAGIKTRYDSLKAVYNGVAPVYGSGLITTTGKIATPVQYFYHSDHLGSSSLITDAKGSVTQHVEYVPYGEVLLEECISNWKVPYKFNAKELDEETGLYYYGARYYDPRTGIWISVDPLAEKFAGVGSYVYCYDNPIKYVDPDGKNPADHYFVVFWQQGMTQANISTEKQAKIMQKAGRDILLRYATPYEDVRGFFTGRDLDNNSYNRAEAATWAIVGFVPISKLAKGLKLLPTVFKYSDDINKLVKITGKLKPEAKEIITITKSGTREDAMKVVNSIIGDLGEDAVSTTGKFGSQEGKTTGKMSVDGSKGFRIDFDAEKGAHINWTNGKQKGAVLFNASENQVNQIISNEILK